MNYRSFMADPQRDCAIIAHRGIWRDAPENSLKAIQRAIEEGHDVVEIDVRRCLDGQFHLCHDETLERMTGLDRPVETMLAAELAALPLRNRDGGVGNAPTDQIVPNLTDVFALTRDRILIHLDIKDRTLIPEVIALAQSLDIDQQVDVWHTLSSQDDLAWVQANVMAMNIPFIAKTRLNAANGAEQLDLVLALRPLICEIYFDHLKDVAAQAARFRDAGIALWVNTLDDVSSAGFTDTAALADPDAVWGLLLDAGISAIQTDQPAALGAYLERR